jgi:hypothetical protein
MKPRVLRFSVRWIHKKRRTSGLMELNGQKRPKILNGIYVTKVEPDGLGTQHRCLIAFLDK